MNRLIVIGASSGGVSALLQLSAALPADFAAPILVVLHIGTSRSRLPMLMARHCPLDVAHAVDGERIARGQIRLAPPDRHLMVDGERLRLTNGPKENFCRPAIDPLFASAALAWHERTIGVVLTGMLDDGTAGLQTIKRHGGTAVVQDPRDALEPSMPESALHHTAVDHCVPLDALPALLTRLAAIPVAALARRASRTGTGTGNGPGTGIDTDTDIGSAIDTDPDRDTASPTATATDNGTDRAVHEHELLLGKGNPMQHLAALGSPSTFVCPECHGDLWQLKDSQPQRYRCHTGHGFTVRALQESLREASDRATWTALRALQERQILLREMAAGSRAIGDAAAAGRFEKAAEHVDRQLETMRRVLELAPEPVD